jgi:glycosyltransferase involved in cell wall biosynthesis
MKILFIGQNGIPARQDGGQAQHSPDRDEHRVERLAWLLSEQAHDVSVVCSKPYTRGYTRRLGAIQLTRSLTLNPEKAGGWLYLLSSLYHVWRKRPDVVHVHGWRIAALIRILSGVSRRPAHVWTISSLPPLPQWLASFVARSLASAFDAIATPQRFIQYKLMKEYGVLAHYVPDGYEPSPLADIPASHWGLRKGQYCVAITNNPRDISWIARTYSKLNTRKKLVVVGSNARPDTRKKYPLLHICEEQGPRALQSLINQSALVIATDVEHNPGLLLHAMDKGKPIIAVNNPLNAELLASSAQLIPDLDRDALQASLQAVVANRPAQAHWGKAAQKRARALFRWDRVQQEYAKLYHYPVIRQVSVDSVIRELPYRHQPAQI